MRIAKICKRLTALILLLFSISVSAQKTLSVAVNVGPPWAYYDEERGVVGIDVDIISSISERLGYQPDFHLLVYNRLIEDFRNGKYDIASPAAFDSAIGFQTSPYLPFEDVAVTLSSRNMTIDTIDDLAGKSIVTYQTARYVLGETFANIIADDHYLEIADREAQLKLLANERTDVVIGERRLLTYIMRQYYPDIKLAIHPIFEARPYGAIIKDEALRDAFETELNNMRAKGELKNIYRRWP
ncbi:amino acid ABC transporter substrate-binding protein [Salinimonas sp. HHU 13199]|uniref:Amino acid ABC transporter substrate-binding protein n=1 Tax=Salinimonas profundi TaxID=2729140 RepID=A0ABR8LM45_9ALTE|nr:transporter substrate-binding domain-containing protein [Salinimonas profundi]MBD3584994.1 amino acid ABC transporter substrate-binding protein [Salinimonas profundi]